MWPRLVRALGAGSRMLASRPARRWAVLQQAQQRGNHRAIASAAAAAPAPTSKGGPEGEKVPEKPPRR